jgi:hypothetical protein
VNADCEDRGETGDGKSRQADAGSGQRKLDNFGGQIQGHRVVARSWIQTAAIAQSGSPCCRVGWPRARKATFPPSYLHRVDAHDLQMLRDAAGYNLAPVFSSEWPLC